MTIERLEEISNITASAIYGGFFENGWQRLVDWNNDIQDLINAEIERQKAQGELLDAEIERQVVTNRMVEQLIDDLERSDIYLQYELNESDLKEWEKVLIVAGLKSLLGEK